MGEKMSDARKDPPFHLRATKVVAPPRYRVVVQDPLTGETLAFEGTEAEIAAWADALPDRNGATEGAGS